LNPGCQIAGQAQDVCIFFLTRSADLLPNLDQYFHWSGGGSAN